MEQYFLPKKLDFKHLRLCLDKIIQQKGFLSEIAADMMRMASIEAKVLLRLVKILRAELLISVKINQGYTF